MICNAGEVVVTPFPFSERAGHKPRPCLVLSSASFNQQSGHTTLLMITTGQDTQWPHDISISDLESCGLSHPSVLRFKLFTLDNRILQKKIGCLSPADKQKLFESHKNIFQN